GRVLKVQPISKTIPLPSPKDRCSSIKVANRLRHIPSRTSVIAVLLFGIGFLSLSLIAQAQQKRINILNASRIVGGTYQGQQVRRSLGEVHIRHKTLEMDSDTAYQFINQSKIYAFGSIELDTGTEGRWTISLAYFTDQDFSPLRGRVIIAPDSTTLSGHSVAYSFETKEAHFLDRIRYED